MCACLFVVFRFLVVVRSIKWPGRVRVYVARNPHPVICFSEDFVIKSRRFSCHCGYSDQISLAVYTTQLKAWKPAVREQLLQPNFKDRFTYSNSFSNFFLRVNQSNCVLMSYPNCEIHFPDFFEKALLLASKSGFTPCSILRTQQPHSPSLKKTN